jgi:hypothetical protein
MNGEQPPPAALTVPPAQEGVVAGAGARREHDGPAGSRAAVEGCLNAPGVRRGGLVGGAEFTGGRRECGSQNRAEAGQPRLAGMARVAGGDRQARRRRGARR